MTIDVNLSLFRWPTRRLPLDDTASLVRFLKTKGVTQAWASSFEGILHPDVAGVNHRLADECRRLGEGLLLPFGVVNPQLPDWESDLERCAHLHHMPGIRLYPNYHGYGLNDPRFERLLDLAEEKHLIVQIAVRLEDPRMQHPLLRVPDVDLLPLRSLLMRRPKVRLVLLNAQMSSSTDQLASLIQAGEVSCDIAMLEGIGGLSRQLKTVPANRLLFGSHAPFFVWDAAALKLKESDLPEPIRQQIERENATRLLGPKKS